MVLNENLILTKKDNIEYLSFKKLNELGVVNAFSLKGLDFTITEGPNNSYIKFLNALAIDYNRLVKSHAGHTDKVLIIDKKENQDTADINMDYLKDVDGLITNKQGIALATTSADCLCIILYDPIKKVLANVHSGWKGTFQKIVQNALAKMVKVFDCNAEDVLAFLMPAIRQCHFEVEDDVMTKCREIFEYTGRIDDIIKIGRVLNEVQKYNIDNILINKILLEEMGVAEKNIFDSGICSVCDSDKINSRRADGENFQRATTVVMMQ